MNLTHLHLLLNHFPTVGFGIGMGLFLVSLFRKGDDLKRAQRDETSEEHAGDRAERRGEVTRGRARPAPQDVVIDGRRHETRSRTTRLMARTPTGIARSSGW